MSNSPFSFWRPNPLFIAEIADYLKEKQVLEVFAGNGLMASYLAERGIKIQSTSYFKGYDHSSQKMYYPVVEMGAIEAIKAYGQQADTLLMIWPEANNHAYLAARLFFEIHAVNPDASLVYIGEKTIIEKNILGGCATDPFFADFGKVIHPFQHYSGNYIEVAEVLRPSF